GAWILRDRQPILDVELWPYVGIGAAAEDPDGRLANGGIDERLRRHPERGDVFEGDVGPHHATATERAVEAGGVRRFRLHDTLIAIECNIEPLQSGRRLAVERNVEAQADGESR